MKHCSVCKKKKSLINFEKNSNLKSGFGYRCKKCACESGKRIHLKKKFGLTVDQFNDILDKQGNGCAICGSSLGVGSAGKGTRLCVDHCHATGRIRGVLCGHCNVGLGFFKDNRNLLIKAAKYVAK